MSFCLNELALQPALQSELRAEIEAAKEEHSGKLTYETVLGLKLLDRVVSGTYSRYDYLTTMYRYVIKCSMTWEIYNELEMSNQR